MDDQDLPEFAAPPVISIYRVVDALLDDSKALDPRILARLSDLEGEDAEILAENWSKFSSQRRRALVEVLPTLAEKDYLLSYEAVGRIAIVDDDPLIRFGGIQMLIASECDNPELIALLLSLAENDEESNVRAIAATALGQFVYMGEMDTLQSPVRDTLENRLIKITRHDMHVDVRRRGLEALGYSSSESVSQMIAEAFHSDDYLWVASSLFAMGRSADDQWQTNILASIDHPNDRVRLEAVRAAGELSMVDARSTLINYLDDPDQDIRLASIWSLSQIGGKNVPELLARQLKNSTDNEELTFIEQALDNLAFNSDVEGGMGLFFVPELDGVEAEPEAESWNAGNEPNDEIDEEDDDFDDLDQLDRWSIESLIDEEYNIDDDEDSGDW